MRRLACLLALLLALAPGCDGLLQEDPAGDLTPANFYESPADAEAAVVGIYDPMNNGRSFGFYMTDLVFMPNPYVVSRANFRQRYSTYSIDASDNIVFSLWQQIYTTVNRANAAIDRIPDIDMNPDRQRTLIGEARFLRALNYFNAVRLWGEVPLVLEETTSLNNLERPRAPVDSVYQTIVEDLQFAEEALPPTRPPGEAGRATSGAATTLLGKVYLTMAGEPLDDNSRLEPAIAKLEEVVQSGQYRLLEDFGAIFDVNNELNDEVIFAIQHSQTVPNQGTSLSFVAGPIFAPFASDLPIGGQYNFGITEEFYNMYDSTDVRRDVTMVYSYIDRRGIKVTYNGGPFPFYATPNGIAPHKYVDPDQQNTNGDNDAIRLRYADVLLSIAEAENELNGPTTKAFQHLNQVRARAGAPPFDPGASWTQSSLRDSIYVERFREQIFEFHSTFIIRRMGKVEQSIQNSPEAQRLGVTYQPQYDLWPIPQSELARNPQISQNPGWGG